MIACGVCRTDSHLLDGSLLPAGVSYPIVPGHEVAAVVTEIAGPHPSDVDVGDLVLPHLLACCGACPACRTGQDQRCEHAPVLGIQVPGGLADELVWPADRLVPAAGLDPVRAAVLPDAGATAYRALTVADPPADGLLCVTGAGGVGTHVLRLAAALRETVRLVAVVRSEATAERVAALGVPVILGLHGSAKRMLREMGRADAVVDFSGAPEAPAEAVRMLRPGGRLVLGSVAWGDLRLGWIPPFVSREITVTGTYSSTLEDLRRVVALARDGTLPLDGSVSHTIPLAQARQAFEMLEHPPPGMVRVVVRTGADR